MSPDVRPHFHEGLPLCSQEECPNFDGKRCRAMGFRPDRFCEPALIEWHRLLREGRGLLHESSDLDAARSNAGERSNLLGDKWHADNDEWTESYVWATGIRRVR